MALAAVAVGLVYVTDPPKRRRAVCEGASFQEHYSVCEKVMGSGNRGTVSLGTHKLSGKQVAIKKIPKHNSSDSEVQEEVNMLQLVGSHPNVIKLRAVFHDADAHYLVMDLERGGELFSRLARDGRFAEGEAARIMAELLQAVAHLHRVGILHLDIKPENIMLRSSEEGNVPEVRLADLGSACHKKDGVLTSQKDYTTAYSAPEVLQSQQVDEKTDIWALGVVMYVLLTGSHPFDTSASLDEEGVARRILCTPVDFNAKALRHVSPEAKTLLRQLLSKDPVARPTAMEALNYPWLDPVATWKNNPR